MCQDAGCALFSEGVSKLCLKGNEEAQAPLRPHPYLTAPGKSSVGGSGSEGLSGGWLTVPCCPLPPVGVKKWSSFQRQLYSTFPAHTRDIHS